MPARVLTGAMCVQRFDDSRNSAIRITYRISLRSSSMPEPRDPLLKVLTHLSCRLRDTPELKSLGHPAGARRASCRGPPWGRLPRQLSGKIHMGLRSFYTLFNDPSAGSPTETLLRLLLPLNDQVWITFRP
jgi:hypothetical protein